VKQSDIMKTRGQYTTNRLQVDRDLAHCASHLIYELGEATYGREDLTLCSQGFGQGGLRDAAGWPTGCNPTISLAPAKTHCRKNSWTFMETGKAAVDSGSNSKVTRPVCTSPTTFKTL
jgi:hypothetical protein